MVNATRLAFAVAVSWTWRRSLDSPGVLTGAGRWSASHTTGLVSRVVRVGEQRLSDAKVAQRGGMI